MKMRKKPALFAALFGGAMLLLQPASFAEPVRIAATSGVFPIAETIRAARLAEPLVATAPTSLEEDLALSHALAAYERRAKPDDVSGLTAFLSKYPHSGWAAALQTNLGLSYLHDGYFSRALDAWQKALHEGKSASDPQARALIDRAVGELARLYTSLGHFDRVAALFDEIGDRPISGSATEAVQVAQETRLLVKKDPRHLFLCGPMALRSLMVAKGVDRPQVSFLDRYRAGLEGTSLAEVARLADSAKFSHRLVFRRPGEPVPVPSIVHWKLGHFAAIIGEANGRFHVQDPVFAGQELWVTPAALDTEASGYFLVPADASIRAAWRTVASKEAAGVWGKGPTNGTRQGDPGDPPADGPDPTDPANGSPDGDNPPPKDPAADNPPNCGGMCGYGIKEASVSVTLSDTPVGYTPPIGLSAKVRITYNQREDSQPAIFSFFNVSPKWTLNWLTYVIDDPTNAGATVSRYMGGGGAFTYSGYSSVTHSFAAQDNDGSTLVLASQSPITYRRILRDGSTEVYAQSNGATSYPRNIFLSQKIDPQGNTLTLNYDGQQRLTSITDATGRQTTFTYGQPGLSLLVTRITDPFGRSATLAYDLSGRLSSITDVIGLTSSFTYDANSLVNSMTTPYGTTSFAYTAPGTSGPPRFVQVTDPLGYNEREEWLEPASIPDSDPAATVPVGMPVTLTNAFLSYRNSFHWDKNAYVVAGCTPTGGCDYTKARIRQFNHVPPNTSLKSTSIGSVKYPFENRKWYVYPGQTSSVYGGSFDKPIAMGRVLDDGTTQLTQYAYDPVTFNLTQVTDPVGRSTRFAYSNGVDLAAVSQSTAYGVQTAIAQFTYNTQHRALMFTDATLKTTYFTYNAAGQLASLTNPLSQTTTYQYDVANNLTTIVNANSLTAASFTYDSFVRVRTYTDSEGWVVTYDYDAADRVTKITYPDGTTDTYTYDKLDLASFRDRQGRVWTYAHDANRRLTTITDPLGQQTVFGYNRIDRLTSLNDPKSNLTGWTYDVQGRLTGKQYADTSTVTYVYETTTSRLKSITDALSQIKQFSYAKDNRLAGITYLSAVHTTPNVTFADDPFFPRLVSMTDGTGTTQYSYVPIGTAGALRLSQESGPLTNGTINYGYDALSRLSSRTVYGSGAETFAYDAIGRLTTHAGDLGSFALSYLGQTGQIAQRQLASANLVTAWSYLPNSGDRRLSAINNTGLATSQFSNYTFTTTPEKFISAIGETSDSTIVYPATLTQTASYNNLNQLTNLSGQALTFDAVGNLTSDGLRNYTWDAENRLIGITYPGQTGKATAFTYDGLSRRTAIASTPTGGGSTVTTSYLWCGARICQARNVSNSPTRGYYDEGEYVPGTPAQKYYYGVDQLGSVRRAFASTSSAPAFSYDPYGKPLQGTAPLTDFNYAGMFFNSDSGLYLTQYRAYDPVPGRWLSRDPLGEMSDKPSSTIPYFLTGGVRSDVRLMQVSGQSDGHGDPVWLKNGFNLYTYVKNEPIYLSDPNGLFPWIGSGGGLGGDTGSGSFSGCVSYEAPFGFAPDGEPVDPAGWRECVLACALASGLHLSPHQPGLEDIPIDPRPPIITPAPPKGRPIK